MTHDRRQYSGNAPATTLSSGIDNSTLTIPLTSGTGYPDGSVGNFYIVIDRGISTEEKILCDTRATNTITALTRGTDGTSAFAHSSGAAVEHVWTKTDADEANSHYADTTLDHHTQYSKVDGTRAFTGVTSITAAPAASAVADTQAAGTATTLARSDHRHAREAFGLPAASAPGDAQAAGVATTVARSDHVHAREAAGGLLAFIQYTGGTGYSMNSSTLADVDATNLAIAFTAPASGNVLIRLQGEFLPNDAGNAVFWALREAAATVTGSEQQMMFVDWVPGNSTSVRLTYDFFVTGLVAASAHTYKWAWRRVSGGTTINLMGGATHYLVMQVWAAP